MEAFKEAYKAFYPTFKFALRDDLINDKRFLPTRAEPKATGWDVRAAMPDKEPLVIQPFEYAKIPLGVRGFCPDGWWYELKPRSSSFAKKNLHPLYGTVDETYEGELVFACQYIPQFKLKRQLMGGSLDYMLALILDADSISPLKIDFGDAIGQIIPVRREEMIVEEVSNYKYDMDCKERDSIRGAGGFGSTGK
jgi:dUTPase